MWYDDGLNLGRAVSNWDFICKAPSEDYFVKDLEDARQEVKDELDENGSIPCEGSGCPGLWCVDCRFGEANEVDTAYGADS